MIAATAAAASSFVSNQRTSPWPAARAASASARHVSPEQTSRSQERAATAPGFAVLGLFELAQFGHPAEQCDSPAREAGEHLQGPRERRRARVV